MPVPPVLNLKIVVSGFYRTGTTHVYNIVQQLLAATGMGHVYMGANAERIDDALAIPGIVIIKTHDCFVKPSTHVRTIHCVRNPVDTVGSNMRLNGTTPEQLNTAQIIRGISKGLQFAKTHGVLVIDYEELYGVPEEKVRRIAEYIGLQCTLEAIDRIVKGTSIAHAKEVMAELSHKGALADPETQLRWQHVGRHNGRPMHYYRILPQQLIDTIEAGTGEGR